MKVLLILILLNTVLINCGEKESQKKETLDTASKEENQNKNKDQNDQINNWKVPFDWVLIKKGDFLMGSPPKELGHEKDEAPQHKINITRDFYMMDHEVTQGEWISVFKKNPSQYPDCGNTCPVEFVNWFETLVFANALSKKDSLEQCYIMENCNTKEPGNGFRCEIVKFKGLSCNGFRLPTEAEWEYAARSGKQTALQNGSLNREDCGIDKNLNAVGWYCANTGHQDNKMPQKVKSKKPNQWGLYDVSGNVWEWVWDLYNETYYQNKINIDPQGPKEGIDRVIRGGSWYDYAPLLRLANRNAWPPKTRGAVIGFRLVKTKDVKKQ